MASPVWRNRSPLPVPGRRCTTFDRDSAAPYDRAVDKLLYIALGGGVGSVLRYLLSGWGQRLSGGVSFPWGTLSVNVLGCLAMGMLGAVFGGPQRPREEVRLLLVV